MNLTKEEKQEVIDNHVGVLEVVPFEIEILISAEKWVKATLVSKSHYDECVVLDSNNHIKYIKAAECRLPQEKRTRPMTTKEISVQDCGECPFRGSFEHGLIEWCVIDEELRKVNIFKDPPAWCQLRVGDVLVKRKEGENETI